VEFLVALGYRALPGKSRAMCGIRRTSEELCGHAEAGVFPGHLPYARTDIGSVLSGKTPAGRLPKPDLLLCCTNICQTVLYWYQVLAHHFKVPLVLIDTPFIYREAQDHAVAFVKKQLEHGVEEAERVAGKSLAPRDLERTTILSKEAVELWKRIIETGRHRPSPITAFDEFIHMAPVVEMRGEAATVDYYAAMLAELEQRAARGEGAVRNEKKRLLWDNLPVWYRVRQFSELFARQGVSLVASTYTNAWGELAGFIDPARPIESAARVYMYPILNRGTGDKLATIGKMIKEYQADGVILHSDRSCKPYSIGQMDQRQRLSEELGVPALLLEADHNDPRCFSEEQAQTRLGAFMEVLEG
jgi:benzoyl-CoA reductase/2-hydroxyglutaryl-CoA dehydratase subunit BcrC/BadD/HgdB